MKRPKVAVTGASGYIGSQLIARLLPEYDIIALSRSPIQEEPGLEWRYCDLFSLIQAEDGLKGADFAFYLVHSMLPSAHLTQGHFSDMDLILADNFARACADNGVQQIIYLGGIIPPGAELSEHLRSRLEVEECLSGRQIPLTSIRASIIVGARGSSFQILEKMVKRLPVILCPPWTLSKTQPIALQDMIELLAASLGRPACFHQKFDVGGPDIMSYMSLIQTTAEVMGLKRLILQVPWMSMRLSRWWLSEITRSPHELVNPLVESLKHPMVAQDLRLQEQLGIKGLPFREAVQKALIAQKQTPYKPIKSRSRFTQSLQFQDEIYPKDLKVVRSVQRLPLPQGRNALWMAEKYTIWLPRFLRLLVQVNVDENRICSFCMRGLRQPLLVLKFSPERSSLDRPLFYITGGILVSKRKGLMRGRLEFREVLKGKTIIAAIHDFSPSLPWFIYNWTQALVHLWVMEGFRHYLSSSE